MTHIVILGAGVMGSALCVPASENNHKITLVGSPLDDEIVDSIKTSRHHPALDVNLPSSVVTLKDHECDAAVLRNADLIIIGVSSGGINWATNKIRAANVTPALVSLVTKGLVANPQTNSPPLTFAHTLPDTLGVPAHKLVGIGGPCIARELAQNIPTRVIFGSQDINASNAMRELFQTNTYRIKTTTEIVEVEACAALKNFLCIGVSAMFSKFTIGDGYAKNPVAALFNQAVIELRLLSQWIAFTDNYPHASHRVKQDPVAFDLAGLGDLHVTVGGGRNSKLGQYLGQGLTLSSVLENQMLNVTVEGVDTGRELSAGFKAACISGDLQESEFPLTRAILSCIDSGTTFDFTFTDLPG